ncbi:MAG: beta strand repeat-containing protein [Luteolibacter sp.]
MNTKNLIISALCLASAEVALADTFTWTGLGNTRWTTATNWDAGTPPQLNTTDVIFPETDRDGANTFGNFTFRSLTYNSTIVDPQAANIHRGNTQTRNITFDTDSETENAQFVIEAGSTGNVTYNNILAQNGFILNDSLDIVHNGGGILTFNVPVRNGVGTGHQLTKSGTGTFVFNGISSLDGEIIVEEGVFTLGDAGSLAFAPLGDGVTNSLKGGTTGGSVNLDGTFNIDLAGTDTTAGNSWLLVDNSTLASPAIYGPTFLPTSSLGDFAEDVVDSGIWVLKAGASNYTFTESTGTLTVADATDVKYWTGFTDSTWDAATTPNWTNNEAADPLENVTFDVAVLTKNEAFFADFYEENGGMTPVTQNMVTIGGTGGVQTGLIGFLNTGALDYTITSPDTDGITGSTNLALRGSGTVTLLGGHATTGALTIDAGNTLNLGNGTTDGTLASVSSFVNDGTLVIDKTEAAETITVGISGSGSFEKKGAETLTFSGLNSNTYTGSTTITAGTLTYSGVTTLSDLHQIAAGATLEFNNLDPLGNVNYLNNFVFSGNGNVIKTGAGQVRLGGAILTFELGSGTLFDIQEGLIRAGNNINEVWTNNLSDLNLATGTVLIARLSNARFDELTGLGTVQWGTTLESSDTNGIVEFTLGVDNGTNTFDGLLQNNSDDVLRPGHFVKVGTGAQTLTGLNTYTGNTTVEAGTLTLTDTSSMAFYLTDNGVGTQIRGIESGTGTINLNGELNLNLSAADISVGNNWLLIDRADLTANIDPTTFSVTSSLGAFTETSPGIWELDTLGRLFTFTEADGDLEIAEGTPAPAYTAWWVENYRFLSDVSPTADPDGDGVLNVLEYVLNRNPEVHDPAIIPTVDASTSDFVFTFDRLEVSDTDTTQVFQYGSDLLGWTDVSISAPTAAEVSIGTAVDGIQTVTVTISKTLELDGKLFGRLEATLIE